MVGYQFDDGERYYGQWHFREHMNNGGITTDLATV